MPAPTKVKIRINAKDTSIKAVICSTYRLIRDGKPAKMKYRLHDSVTISQGMAVLKHPGEKGLVSVQGLDSNTQVVFSSTKEVKRK